MDRVSAVPKLSTVAVQTVAISNAARNDNNLVDVYQLSKAKFGLTHWNQSKSLYYLGCQIYAWCTSKSFGSRVGDDMVRIAITTCQSKVFVSKPSAFVSLGLFCWMHLKIWDHLFFNREIFVPEQKLSNKGIH